MVVLGNIGKGDNITWVAVVTCLVGNPHLDAADVYARQYCWQLGHGTVIVVAEIVGKEEVLVLVVVGYFNLECSELCAAFRVYDSAV